MRAMRMTRVLRAMGAVREVQGMRELRSARATRWMRLLGCGACAMVVTACASEGGAGNARPFQLTSAAFQPGAPIPARFTCEGADVAPALAWTNAPAGTRSFALIMDDPDARNFTHWVLFNMPASTSALPEGVRTATLPEGAVEAANGFGAVRYGGPCPPKGVHRYSFRLYALDIATVSPLPTRKDGLVEGMKGHILGQAELIGTYERTGSGK